MLSCLTCVVLKMRKCADTNYFLIGAYYAYVLFWRISCIHDMHQTNSTFSDTFQPDMALLCDRHWKCNCENKVTKTLY